MASLAYRVRREESGMIIPGLLMACVALLATGWLLFQVGHAAALQAEAQTAADAAALAGAREVRDQLMTAMGDPSAINPRTVQTAASDYAQRNDTELVGSQVDGLDVIVTVRTDDGLGAGAASLDAEGRQGEASARARVTGGGPFLPATDGAPEVIPAVSTDAGRVWPVNGRFTSPFGTRIHPIHGTARHHPGIDLAAPMGTPIVAAAAGEVIFAGDMGGYGLTVDIRHPDGLVTRYAHQSRLGVTVGQPVDAGQVIGFVGSTGVSTGPHLHFEVRINNNATAVNPLPWLEGAEIVGNLAALDIESWVPYEVVLVGLDG